MANSAPQRATLAENWMVLGCCALASLAAIGWSWANGAIQNYGDAVAHLQIARRVLDSHRPGLTQLGSVWLPLPHLLMLPFVQIYAWWNNGLAGTIPSALAYLAACVGFFQLARRWLPPSTAAIALALFAFNPNLLYLQSTAMTEPLFLCEMVWAALLLAKWHAALDIDEERAARMLPWINVVLVAAVFTRYDGWILAFLAWVAMAGALTRRKQILTQGFFWFSLALLAAPLIWFAYNGGAFGDWLYFARGPYSAAAIEARTATPGQIPHPGWHNPWVALAFFVKAAELDTFAALWSRPLLWISVAASLLAWALRRKSGFAWAALLWFPLPFYAYSVSFGSVPIFLPVWWPHSWYNTRYGLELLPALALGAGFAAHLLVELARDFKPKLARVVLALLCVAVVANGWLIIGQGPLTYVEGVKNIESRRAFEEQIPPRLRSLLDEHPGRQVLMITSRFPRIVSLTGIPLRQTINESDKEYYRAALAEPARHTALVLAFGGDPVAAAVQAHPEGLELVQSFSVPGQPEAFLYRSVTPQGNPSPAQQ